MNPKTILCIGGGTGLYSLLSGLKNFPSELIKIKAIVTTLDDGGSSGKLITQFGILPPGDIRNCLIALSEESVILRDLFQYHFEDNIDNHNFGNLFLTALNEITGSFDTAIKEASKILRVKGEVIPVCLKPNSLIAEFANGKHIEGESEIAKEGSKIINLSLKKNTKANPRAIKIAQEADFIILGPGSLYTSILPNILFPQLKKAIKNNHKAKKILITNVMSEPGETDNYHVSDFIKETEKYLDTKLDFILSNSNIPDKNTLKLYKKERKKPIRIDAKHINPDILIPSDYIDHHSVVRHDPDKLALAIINLLYKEKIFRKKQGIQENSLKKTITSPLKQS